MEGKKKYFALVLFLFLGLMIFTFANPVEDESKDFVDGDAEQSEKTDNRKEETTNDQTTDQTNEGQEEQNVLNNVTNDNNQNTDNSLALALAAVEKAEGTYSQEDVEAAKELLNNVTDTTEKGNLEDRLEEVEAGIAVLALLDNLEQQVEDAEEKSHMTDATTYRDENEIADKIEALNNETVKENLAKRLAEVSKLLDDNAAPVASVEAKAYNDHVEITAEDEAGNAFKLFLTKDNGTEEEITSGDKTTSEGVYTLRLVDDAFNENTITFVVDKTAPTLKDVTNGGHYKDITLNVEDKTEVTIKVTNMDTKEEKEVSNGTKLTEDATYMIELTDEAGNFNYYYLAIDSVKPTISTTDKSYINYNKWLEVKDKFLTNVTITRVDPKGNVTTEEFTRADFTVGERNENFTLRYKLELEGTYTITGVDKYGNSKTETVTVDKTAPKASYVALLSNGTKDPKYIKNGEQIRVLVAFDEEIKVTDKFVLTVNGKNIKFVRSGDKSKYEYIAQYTIPANEENMKEGKVEFAISGYQDLAGNTVKEALTKATHKTYNSLTYDRTPAKITLKGKDKVLEPGYYTYDLYAYIDDANSYTATLNDSSKDIAYTSGSKISSRTNYVLTVVDAAGNTSSIEFAIDKDKPAIKGVTDGKYYNTSVTPTVTDRNLDKVTLNGNDYVSGTEITEEGTYTLVATDKANNTRKVTFTIDTTNPTIAISAKQNKWTNTHPVTITVTEKNLDKVYYAWTGTYKNTDSDEHRLNFLKNAEAVPADKIVDNGNGTYTITFDTDFQGSNKLVVKVTDLAGNVSTKSSEWVRIDDIAPLYDKLAIRGAAGEWIEKNGVKVDYKQYAGTGTIVYVDAHFYEKLETTPVVTLNGKVTLTSPSTAETTDKDGRKVYIYSYRYELKADDGLEEGPIQVKVTNCKDRAGNSVELTNKDLTMESQSEVIVDRTAPTYDLYVNGKRPVQKPTTIEENGKIYTTDEIELQFHDNYRLKKMTINGKTGTTTAGVTGQVKYITEAGEYVIEAIDAVGNKTSLTIVKVENELDLLNHMDTVTLTKDMTLDKMITIAEGQTKVIDLNGQTLTFKNPDTSSARLMVNEGTLIIKNGTLVNENYKSYGLVDNKSTGTLTIDKVKVIDNGSYDGSSFKNRPGAKLTIENSEFTLKSQKGYYAAVGASVANYGDVKYGNAGVYSEGELIIKNTKFTSDSERSYAITQHAGSAIIEKNIANGVFGGIKIDGGTLVINDTEYTSEQHHGIYIASATKTDVTINGGIFKGKVSGAYIDNGGADTVITFNGGNFTSTEVKTNALRVIGTPANRTITIKGGTFNDTDVTQYIDKTVYRQDTSDWTVKEKAKIDSVAYLKEVAAIGGTYTLDSELTLTNEPIKVPTGVNLTINTNGQKISGTSDKSATSKLFEVAAGGSLTLTGNGTITFRAYAPDTNWDPEGFPTYATNTIANSGTLIIDGPTIINTTPRGGASYAIDNYAGGNLTVLSGTIKQTGGDVAIRMNTATPGEAKANNVTINGGTISGRRAIWIHLAGSSNATAPYVNLTVNGGTLSSTDVNDRNLAIYSYSYGNSFANVKVEFNNGTINGNVAFGATGDYAKTSAETILVNGGTFNGDLGYYDEADEWVSLK